MHAACRLGFPASSHLIVSGRLELEEGAELERGGPIPHDIARDYAADPLGDAALDFVVEELDPDGRETVNVLRTPLRTAEPACS